MNGYGDAPKVLELSINSLALKKQLAKELFELYSETRLIFTEYKKDSNIFTVRRWRDQKQNVN